MGSLHDQMLAVLDAPLSSLIQPQAQVRASTVIDQWHLPESDRWALRTWGLPEGPLLRPTPQAESQPVLAPNIASEAERRLLSADQRLYLLGIYGADFNPSLSIRVGAVAGTGQVMGIRARPVTTDDIAAQLRTLHPNLYHPAVCHFNRSAAAFVEVAWRCGLAGPVPARNRHQTKIIRPARRARGACSGDRRWTNLSKGGGWRYLTTTAGANDEYRTLRIGALHQQKYRGEHGRGAAARSRQ
jgi:hypothetical protein